MKVMMKKIWVVFTMILCMPLFSCSSTKQAKAEDFSLMLSINATEFSLNDEVVISAVFTNLTDNNFRIVAHTAANESLISIYYYPKGTDPDTSTTSIAVQSTIKKGAQIKKKISISNLSVGEYETFALVAFTSNGNSITLYSTTYQFVIV